MTGYLGHKAVIEPRFGAAAPPADPGVLPVFAEAAVADISDAVGRLYTMSTAIRPLYEPMGRVLGSALTVRMPPGDNWAAFGALELVQPGDVLVIDWMGYRGGSGSGANFIRVGRGRGLAGVVIDGDWRDVEELRELNFPVLGRGIAPFSPSKREFGEVNVPVCCGNVIVEPGDLIIGDSGGVVVVPRRHIGRVVRYLGSRKQESAVSATAASEKRIEAMAAQYRSSHHETRRSS